MTFNPYSIHIQ